MKKVYILILLFFSSGYLVAQNITLLTEPIENRINDIAIYGQVTGSELPDNIAVKINDDIYTVAVNDTGLFIQPYVLNEGINEVSVALTTSGLDNPADVQKLTYIDYKLPHVSIDGSISGTTISLTANGTSPVGSGLNYAWSLGENNPKFIALSSTTGTSVSFQKPLVNGEYYIYCTATDDDGRAFKSGRFLRVEDDYCYLNNENMHAAWVDSIMMYEYQLFRFNYDEKLSFIRIAEKFNHIRNLGANAVWHTPPTLGGGGNYFPNDYYLIDPEYGTNLDYKQFVEKAHAAGLKVIFDIPVSHTNSNHYFLNNVYALKENSPYKDYYHWAGEPGNSAVTYSPDNGPNCVYTNVGNDEFKEYLLRVLEYWVREYDIDGYRYDCGQEIYNRDDYFLQEAQRRLRNIKPDIALFIEGNYIENPDYLTVADVCYDWMLHGWGTLNGFKGVFEQNITPNQFHNDFMQSFADSTLPLRYCNTGYFDPVHQTYGWEQEKTGHIIAFTGFGSSLIYAGTETGSDAGQIYWEADLSMYPFMRKLVKVKKELLGSYPEMKRLASSVPDKVYSYLSKNSDNRIVVASNLSPDVQTCTINLDVEEINSLSAFQFQDLINDTVIDIAESSLGVVEINLNPWETKMFWIGESSIEFEKEVSSINIVNTELIIDKHQGSLQLKYEVLPGDALDKRVIWTVNNNEMATISESGLIRATGIENGNLQVTASAIDDSDVQKVISVNISNQGKYHNFIMNSGFDEYLDYWKLTYYSGLVEFNFDYHRAEINITEEATNQWDIQLMQPSIILEPNTDYVLSFEAKTSVEQNVLVSLTDVIWQDTYITSQWNTFSIPFTTSDNTELLFSLMMGNNVGEFSFDNFVIIKETSTKLVKVTFQVDMQGKEVSSNGVFMKGNWNGWNEAVQLQSAGGSVYSATIAFESKSKIDYKFFNGDPSGSWDSYEQESFTGICTDEWTNRVIEIAYTDTVLDAVCFNSCEVCETAYYAISTIVSPQEGGDVQGAGTYESGSSATLIATAKDGYEFVNWTVIGSAVSSESTYNFVVTKDITIQANFKELEATTYQVSVDINPANAGTAIGAGIYEEGESVTVIATAKDGYEFVNWTVDGAEVSSESTYTFVVTKDITVQANFKELEVSTYQVSVDINPVNSGLATGSGTYKEGENVTVIATANEGYKFVNWTIDGAEVSSESTYTFVVTKDITVQANFKELEATTYQVSIEINPANAGTAIGAGIYEEGESVTVIATANEGYEFVNWTVDGAEVSSESTYTFEVKKDLALVANFAAVTEHVEVTFQVDMQNETVSSSGVFLRGTFNGSSSTERLSNDGDIYYKALELEPGTEVLYKFVNGDNWEQLSSGPCTKTTDQTNRVLIVPDENTTLGAVCFNSCSNCSTTSINDNKGEAICVFPNPTENSFYLTNLPVERHIMVKVFNTNGQLVREIYTSNKSSIQIELSDVNAGLYLLKIIGVDINKNMKITKVDCK